MLSGLDQQHIDGGRSTDTGASRPVCRQHNTPPKRRLSLQSLHPRPPCCCVTVVRFFCRVVLRPVCLQLCDFGCAKKRNDEPRYGPASGTKDWQAPEQMAADLVKGPVGAWANEGAGPPAVGSR